MIPNQRGGHSWNYCLFNGVLLYRGSKIVIIDHVWVPPIFLRPEGCREHIKVGKHWFIIFTDFGQAFMEVSSLSVFLLLTIGPQNVTNLKILNEKDSKLKLRIRGKCFFCCSKDL